MAFLVNNGKFVLAQNGKIVLAVPKGDAPDNSFLTTDGLYLNDKEDQYITFTPNTSN